MIFRAGSFFLALLLTLGFFALFSHFIPVLTPPEAKIKVFRLNLKPELVHKKTQVRQIALNTPKLERNFNPNSGYQILNKIKKESKGLSGKKENKPKKVLTPSANPDIIAVKNLEKPSVFYPGNREGENLPGAISGPAGYSSESGLENARANFAPSLPKPEAPPATNREILAGFQSLVSQKLDAAKEYPVEAREQKMTGVVVLSFLVKPDGRPVGIQIVSDSGFPPLDWAAREAVNAAAPFLPFPQGFPEGIKVKSRLVFKLSR